MDPLFEEKLIERRKKYPRKGIDPDRTLPEVMEDLEEIVHGHEQVVRYYKPEYEYYYTEAA